MVIHEAISILNLPALLCAVSTTGLPNHGILEKLDRLEEERLGRSKRRATCSIVNDLSSFEAKSEYEEEAPGDEEEAEDFAISRL